MVEAVDGGRGGAGGSGLVEIEAMGEEFGALGGGDEDESGRGLGFELGESRAEGIDDGGAETVVVVIANESEEEEVAPLL